MSVAGVGIHSGRACEVRLHRVDGPVRFLRNGTTIPADVSAVASTERCTTLAAGAERVAMVEHLLAALRVTGWWSGVAVEASAEELPILDGSAEPWLEPIRALGTPPEPPAELAPERPIVAERGLSMVRWEAGPTEVCAHIEFDHPAIGAQTWCGGPDRWAEVLAARTFGFVSEADALLDRGLARGASVENAIVFLEEGPLRPLRTPQEPVRHKVLDLLGDLFLLGRPLAGRITANRGSHALHLDFMRSLTHLSPSARRRRP